MMNKLQIKALQNNLDLRADLIVIIDLDLLEGAVDFCHLQSLWNFKWCCIFCIIMTHVDLRFVAIPNKRHQFHN